MGGVCAPYHVSDYAYRISCGKTGQANRQAASQMHETLVQTVALLRGRTNVASYQDCNYEGVHSNDTGHDDGDKRLEGRQRMRTHYFISRGHAFMMRSGLKVPTPEIPMPDLAVPYAAPMPGKNE